MELLKELCECSGVPGREGRLREIVRRELEPIADELRVDGMGNLIIKKNASAEENPKKTNAGRAHGRNRLCRVPYRQTGSLAPGTSGRA